MKSSIVFIIVAIFALAVLIYFSGNETPSEEDLYGVWQGEYQGTEVLFRFNGDRTCLLTYKNSDSGETSEMRGTFETDFSKTPIPLSIRNIPQLDHGLYTIIKFTGDGTLTVADFSTRWRARPVAFQLDSEINLTPVH